jgi:hypothetical protein
VVERQSQIQAVQARGFQTDAYRTAAGFQPVHHGLLLAGSVGEHARGLGRSGTAPSHD